MKGTERARRATAEQIRRLAGFSTCEIADALVKLKHPSGGYVPDLERFSGSEKGNLVGEVFTVEMVDGRATDAPKLEGHFVDQATPDTVLFISTPPHARSASLGGLLATALHKKGVRGVVTSGRCRDLAELRALDFPVFARGHSILGQSPFTRPSRLQVPLTIAPTSSSSSPDLDFPATTVHPFDVVLADLDGVVVIRPDLLEEAMELAAKGREVDERCRQDLLEGKGVKETFKKHRGNTSPAQPGLFAFVTIAGQAAKLHRTSDGDYIECVLGEPFQVTFVDNRMTSPGHSYEVTLWTDGVYANRRVVRSNDPLFQTPLGDSSRVFLFNGQIESATTVRQLVFRAVKTLDDDGQCTDQNLAKEVGRIELCYIRVRNLQNIGWIEPSLRKLTRRVWAEEAKPAGSCSTEPGKVLAVGPQRYNGYDRIDPEDSPFFSLAVRYETREMLELLGVIRADKQEDDELVVLKWTTLDSTNALGGRGGAKAGKRKGKAAKEAKSVRFAAITVDSDDDADGSEDVIVLS
ncbi:4-hydroxy-4-methyl-2-oxoglutarate aldolase [Rhodotorula toruloides]|nr:4-hydroxy-4-methyl-2-oxoglutarate aldolase [Rhodotorula toruloides]